MNDLLSVFLTWNFIIFSLSIAGITFVTRKIVEYCLEKGTPDNVHPTKATIWTELMVPILPLLLGGLGGFMISGYSYPEGIVSSSSRTGWGLVAGMFSGLLYKIIKGLLVQKLPEEIASKLPENPINDIELKK